VLESGRSAWIEFQDFGLYGVLVTVMQKVPLSKPLKYHDKSHKKSLSH